MRNPTAHMTAHTPHTMKAYAHPASRVLDIYPDLLMTGFYNTPGDGEDYTRQQSGDWEFDREDDDIAPEDGTR